MNETEKAIEDIKEAKIILLCNNILELIVAVSEGQKQGLFKNKFWNLKNDEELDLNKLKDIAIVLVLKELEKKDKIIDLMLSFLDCLQLSKDIEGYENMTKEDWKQYFENKANEEGDSNVKNQRMLSKNKKRLV